MQRAVKSVLVWSVLALVASAQSTERGFDVKEDAWYKVNQVGDENKYVGFIHITVESVEEDGRPLVHYYEEGQYFLPGLERGWREDYWFDNELVLVRGRSLHRSGDSEVDVQSVFDGKTLTRACIAPALEAQYKWSRENRCWPYNFMTVALRRRGWETGDVLDVSCFGIETTGEKPLDEKKFKLTVKGQGKKPVIDTEQNCWMLELAEADGKGSITSLVVDARGFLVEQLTSQTVVRRVKDDTAARNGNKFIWAHGGRRDPFRNVMKPKVVKVVKPGQETTKPIEPLNEKQIANLLVKSQEALEQMERVSELPEDLSREKKLQSLFEVISLNDQQIKQSTNQASIQRSASIVASAGSLYNPVRAAVASAKDKLQKIMSNFETKEKVLLLEIPKLLEDLRAIAQNPALAGTPQQPTVNEMLDRGAQIEKRARIVLQVQEKQGDLQPNGIIYVQKPRPFDLEFGVGLFGTRVSVLTTIKLPVSESVAVIGDRAYEEGEPHPLMDDLFVDQIEQDGVTYNYKGERVKIPLKNF